MTSIQIAIVVETNNDSKSTELVINETSKETFPEVASKPSRSSSLLKSCAVEVLMFLYMFSYVVRSISATNMILDKVCLVHLNYSEEICFNLKNHSAIKSEVEKLGNNYHLAHSMIQIIPSALLICFIGPWSDRYGRKPPVVIAQLGIIIDGLGSTFCAYFLYSRVDYYFIPAFLTGFSGGFVSVMTVLFSYASDVTSTGKRTMKYAFLEAAFGMAVPLGATAGGWIYAFSGYVTVFLVSTSGHVLGLVWVLFLLDETRGIGNEDGWKVRFRELWSFDAVVENFRVSVKWRPHNGRAQILMLIGAMSILILTMISSSSIGYLYVHHVYDWGNTRFSTISAIYAVFGMVAMMIAVPLSKKLKAGDPTLGIIGTISMVLKNIGMGLAYKPGIYYLANLMGLLSSLASLAARSRISKVVSSDELGKVFSFVSTTEAILPIIAGSMFSQIFNASLDTNPGLAYLILGSLMVIPLLIFVWMALLPHRNYEEMMNHATSKTNEKTNLKNIPT